MSPATADVRLAPYAHATATDVVDPALADAALRWMEADAPWTLRAADFYEQWELHLDHATLPQALAGLLAPDFQAELGDRLLGDICGELELVELTAHKLLDGQTIRIHNDFIGGAETHRILIQLNRGWRDDQGGLLMLFGSADPADVRRVIRPLHRSAFGFSISDHSFHAVSTVSEGERYTLVYSFRRPACNVEQ